MVYNSSPQLKEPLSLAYISFTQRPLLSQFPSSREDSLKFAIMTTQKGLVIEKPGGPFKIVDNLPRSTPGPKQALVKSLLVALNPV